MENHNEPLDKSEVEYLINEALLQAFNTHSRDRQIQYYKVFKYLDKNQYSSFNFEESIAATRSDILSDHNIEMK